MAVPKSRVDIGQIQTVKPGGGKGVKIHTGIYMEVARAIFQHVGRQDELTIVDLLGRIEDDFQKRKENENLIYIALHVKLDLEGRGYLKLARSKANPGQIQKCIGITKRGWRYFKSITSTD